MVHDVYKNGRKIGVMEKGDGDQKTTIHEGKGNPRIPKNLSVKED
jgi:hypothetical protein